MLLYSEKTYAKNLLKNINSIKNDMGDDSMDSCDTSTDNASIVSIIGSLAVVIISGDIMIHSGLSLKGQLACNVCDLDSVNAAIDSLVLNDTVTTVLFWFNTYGGGADGLYTTWGNIDKLSQSKFCVAFCDSKMCSAGYLLASACPLILSTKDSTIGSIGSVICIENDEDDMVIASGEYKAASNGSVQTQSQMNYLQNMVNQEGNRFWEIANVKHTLNEELKKGGVYRFEDQINYGLVEYQVENLKEVITTLLQ